MKKKFYLAVIGMCMMFAASACSEQTETEENTVQTEEDAQTEETAQADGEEEDTEEKPSSFGTRLVSVDNVDK